VTKDRSGHLPFNYMLSHATEQPGSACVFHLFRRNEARCARHNNIPGFGVGFGGAGRVGTEVIINC